MVQDSFEKLPAQVPGLLCWGSSLTAAPKMWTKNSRTIHKQLSTNHYFNATKRWLAFFRHRSDSTYKCGDGDTGIREA
jgi:hypothetical protein